MRVIFAQEMGFCYGVRRAVESAIASAETPGGAVTLGPIIHNPQVVQELKELGVGVTDSLENLPVKRVIIRSHGVGPLIYEEAQAQGLEILDATCPHVRKVREAVLTFAKEGRRIIIVGEPDHPEVQGVKAWAGDKSQVISSVQEAAEFALGESIGIVAQTTFQNSIFSEIVKVLETKAEDVAVRNTICAATELRQQAVRDLCEKVEIVVVVGGKNSGNTRRLAEIAKEEDKSVILVETGEELDPTWFENISVVGITAGASTPDRIIQDVATRLKAFGKQERQEGEKIMENMEQMLSEEIVGSIKTGQLIKGVVTTVYAEGLFVHLGGKSDGFISHNEVLLPEGKSLEEAFPVGSEVEALVLQTQNSEGHPVLSQSRALREAFWQEMPEKVERGETVQGTVKEVVKGGVTVSVQGIRAFVPASQMELTRVEDFGPYVGQTLEFLPIECEPERQRLVLSRRALLQKIEATQKAEVLSKLAVDQVVTGTVKRLTDFGAFVDIGGIDGLIHLSRLSWAKVKKASDVLAVGDTVEVKIVELDPEKGKVGLSLKDLLPDPWHSTAKEFKQGQAVKGKIVRIAPFGAFVEIAPGVDALLPATEITEDRSDKSLTTLEVGQEIEAKLQRIDLEQKRISLSMRRLAQDKEKAEYQPFLTKNEDELKVSLGDQFGSLLEKFRK